jgi:hypothetical protein
LHALPRYATHKKPAAGLGPTAGSVPIFINESRNFEGSEEFPRPLVRQHSKMSDLHAFSGCSAEKADPSRIELGSIAGVYLSCQTHSTTFGPTPFALSAKRELCRRAG